MKQAWWFRTLSGCLRTSISLFLSLALTVSLYVFFFLDKLIYHERQFNHSKMKNNVMPIILLRCADFNMRWCVVAVYRLSTYRTLTHTHTYSLHWLAHYYASKNKKKKNKRKRNVCVDCTEKYTLAFISWCNRIQSITIASFYGYSAMIFIFNSLQSTH